MGNLLTAMSLLGEDALRDLRRPLDAATEENDDASILICR